LRSPRRPQPACATWVPSSATAAVLVDGQQQPFFRTVVTVLLSVLLVLVLVSVLPQMVPVSVLLLLCKLWRATHGVPHTPVNA
jgi:hypothetical protein